MYNGITPGRFRAARPMWQTGGGQCTEKQGSTRDKRRRQHAGIPSSNAMTIFGSPAYSCPDHGFPTHGAAQDNYSMFGLPGFARLKPRSNVTNGASAASGVHVGEVRIGRVRR